LNATLLIPAPNDAAASMRERARALRLWIIRCDVDGRVLPDPGESRTGDERILAAWISSGYVRNHLRDAARKWASDDIPEPTEIVSGCWAIPLPEMHRRRRIGYCVAIALTPDATQGEHFDAACQSARLDTRAAQSACRPCAVHRDEEVGRLALLLNWAHMDRIEVETQEASIIELSGQLAESYEEISLLYTLGASMRELVQPGKFVRLMCEQLQETLFFRWVAVRFLADANGVGQLSGVCEVSGSPGCEQEEMEQRIDALLAKHDGATPAVIEAHDKPGGIQWLGAQALLQPLIREGRTVGAIVAGDKMADDAAVSSVDMKLLDAASDYLLVLIENASLYDEQRAMFLGTLEALTAAIDAKDPYTRGHSQRVAHLSMRLAMALGFNEDIVERVRIGGLVHDIGKIGVPEAVLCKPGKLSKMEFEQIKTHPGIGQRILKDIPQMSDVLPAVLHHHERWDGDGYPDRLQGEQIPLFARIVALADAFDAMRSSRTYRSAMSRQQVLEEIRRCAGSHFDPKLAERFMEIDFARYEQMIRQNIRAPGDGIGRERAA